MILHHTIVEQAVDRAERVRLLKELVVVRVQGGKREVPLAMIRKRHRPQGEDPPRPLAPVLLVHGYGPEPLHLPPPARSLPNYLARAGFDVFNLDLRGHGRSRHLGADDPVHVEDYVRDDVPAALDGILKLSGDRPHLLHRPFHGRAYRLRRGSALTRTSPASSRLASPYHFTRGSWALTLAGRGATVYRPPCSPRHPSRRPSETRRQNHPSVSIVSSRALSSRSRSEASTWASMEPAVLAQHMMLAMDAGSLAILKNLFFGGIEARRGGHQQGGLTGIFRRLRTTRHPSAHHRGDQGRSSRRRHRSSPPSIKAESRDKTYRTFPRGHIDIVVGRDAPFTVWPSARSVDAQAGT